MVEKPNTTERNELQEDRDQQTLAKEAEINTRLSQIIGKPVFDITGSPLDYMKSKIRRGDHEDAFAAVDLNTIAKQFKQWTELLPNVKPYYAVKCNPDPCILRLISQLGGNFDCATQGEIDLVLNGLGEYGASPDQIVYANPLKMDKHLLFALENRVGLTVIDGEDELFKMARLGAVGKMSVLIRLATDDKESVISFSKKFGASTADAPKLLGIAKSLGIDVIGVSFHVGTGCGDPQAYVTALRDARIVFDAAKVLEMPAMKIVDIGGGFPGSESFSLDNKLPTFREIVSAIQAGIQLHFNDVDADFIAEPGRYMVAASTFLATKVYGRKGGQSQHQALFVDDGVFGSFMNVIWEDTLFKPKLFEETSESTPLLPTQIFGPTCDGLDQICKENNTFIPRVEVGDWLFWDEMGAYTHCGSFTFNGYTNIPAKNYVNTA